MTTTTLAGTTTTNPIDLAEQRHRAARARWLAAQDNVTAALGDLRRAKSDMDDAGHEVSDARRHAERTNRES
jgi:hypothetical protein